MKQITRKQKTFLLIAQDIVFLREDFVKNDYDFIFLVLLGKSWNQYDKLVTSQINDQFDCRKKDFDREVYDLAETLRKNFDT